MEGGGWGGEGGGLGGRFGWGVLDGCRDCRGEGGVGGGVGCCGWMQASFVASEHHEPVILHEQH